MPVRYTQKPFVNIPHETDKFKPVNTRDRTFITTCLNELKDKGETICFTKQQIEQIEEHIILTEICYDERNDCYFLFSKR